MNFTIGCDPEIFLRNQQGFKSVIGMIGGDKNNPRKITEEGHAVLEDNVAVEFNIPASNTFEEFRDNILYTMGKIKQILPQDLEYSQESAVSFPENELNTEAAWLFGCEPDYDVWRMCVNEKPHAEDKYLRSAGGHIHVGSDVAIANPVAVIRAMDLFLGVPSIKRDTNGGPRRSLYGKAGACRIKKYGVEYRTLSNFWIFNNEHIQWAYNGTQRALEFVAKGNEISDKDGHLIQKCINESNKEAYEYLSRTYGCI